MPVVAQSIVDLLQRVVDGQRRIVSAAPALHTQQAATMRRGPRRGGGRPGRYRTVVDHRAVRRRHRPADGGEPQPRAGLRAALLARVAAGESLRTRVTVLDRDLLSATLPVSVSAVVLMNVIGHFTPADRRSLWALLADRLTPGGRAVVTPEHLTTELAEHGLRVSAGDPTHGILVISR